MDIQKLYLEEQYDYFKEKGFNFYSKNGYYSSQKFYYAITPEDKQLMAQDKNFYDISPYPISKKQYAEEPKRWHPSYYGFDAAKDKIVQEPPEHTGNQIMFDFFIKFYNKYPEHRKPLIANFHNLFISNNIENSLLRAMRGLTSDKKEALSIIQSFPISVWTIDHVPPRELDAYLVEQKFTETEIDKFWLSFIKKRKAQLNTNSVGLLIKDFLTYKYSNVDQLEPYFDFFTALKNDFKPLEDIDCFLNQTKYSTTAVIDYRKLMKSIPVSIWDLETYANQIEKISAAIKTYHNLEYFNKYREPSTRTLHIVFEHNDDNYTRVTFEKELIAVFKELKDAPKADITSLVKSVLLKNILEENMESKTIPAQKRPKI